MHCKHVLSLIDSDWERVDRYGKYCQQFINDEFIESKLETFFGNEFSNKPILKVLRLSSGDSIPTFNADYSTQTDEYFKRYIDTNFIIQIHLNENFKGGNITKIKETHLPQIGYGILQNKSEKCSISKVDGTAYFLFAFISKIKKYSII